MTIEEKIRAKKEEVKRVNRELSKLQDELKKRNEPLYVHITHSSIGPITGKGKHNRKYKLELDIESNKQDCNDIVFLDKIKSAIESLSENPSEPNSYVDWNKIANGHDWVAIDKYSNIYSYHNKPTMDGNSWHSPLPGDWVNVTDIVEKGPLPAWDKSLIHRPGAEE